MTHIENLLNGILFFKRKINWLISVVQWYNNIDRGIKIGIGLTLFALACIITAITGGIGGGAVAALKAVGDLMLSFIVGVVSAVATSALIAWVTGESITDAMMSGLAESIFWGGVFAFVSASVNAVKTVARTYAQGGKACDVVGQCFIAGTLVLCMDEKGNQCHKPIEEVKVGDMVWAYDEETGESDWKPVVRLFRNESKDWTGVTVNGLEIVSTPGHKYYLPETNEWVSAEELKVGAKVLLSNGSYAIIEAVRAIHYEEAQTTYNFEVSDFHTYYVGKHSVCVHNANCGFNSKTVAGPENVGRYKNVRIDVEMNPVGKVDIHIQAKNLPKMHYSNGVFPTAPKKLANSDFVKRGLIKALDYVKRNGWKL